MAGLRLVFERFALSGTAGTVFHVARRGLVPYRRTLFACLWLILIPSLSHASEPTQSARDWAAIEARAAGSTVYFDAWGGDQAVNRYIAWVSDQVRRRFAIRLVHVKVTDIAEAVTRITAEAAAGRRRGGTADLLWINGANFATLRKSGLLYGPWANRLPNSDLIDTRGNPTTVTDFQIPTRGYELAWGTSRFSLFYDASAVAPVPRNAAELLAWVQAHPGRFTYPRPPNFLGTSFLKQLLILTAPDRATLQRPVAADFPRVTAPLWAWLDAVRPYLWRHGRLYPPSGPAQKELLASGELDWTMAFNPLEMERAIRAGEVPSTAKRIAFSQGTLANSHFLAIPFNSDHVDAALVVANFLISPEAQARKADVSVWGDPTVLDSSRTERTAAGPDEPLVADLDPSWMSALEHEWLRRYGAQ